MKECITTAHEAQRFIQDKARPMGANAKPRVLPAEEGAATSEVNEIFIYLMKKHLPQKSNPTGKFEQQEYGQRQELQQELNQKEEVQQLWEIQPWHGGLVLQNGQQSPVLHHQGPRVSPTTQKENSKQTNPEMTVPLSLLLPYPLQSSGFSPLGLSESLTPTPGKICNFVVSICWPSIVSKKTFTKVCSSFLKMGPTKENWHKILLNVGGVKIPILYDIGAAVTCLSRTTFFDKSFT